MYSVHRSGLVTCILMWHPSIQVGVVTLKRVQTFSGVVYRLVTLITWYLIWYLELMKKFDVKNLKI